MSLPSLGWLPDYPDFRDVTPETDQVSRRLKSLDQPPVREMLARVGVGETPRRRTGSAAAAKASAKPSIDLRSWCSPVENQGSLGSCTAHAGVGLVEYFERRAFGRHIEASRLFLYKATRNLLHWSGDTGAFLRSTMQAMTLFGVPPEEYWPYVEADYEKEPTAFCYSFAQSYQALTYYRLDPPGTRPDSLLDSIRTSLSSGLPLMFGFTVYSSISQASPGNGGEIPFPEKGDKLSGGHAVMAVGYDDKRKIQNAARGATATTGALLIRNSWGLGWGDKGYGWLPYAYVERGLASDWWSLLSNEWVNTANFGD
ncbi:MAG: C1 family peptidase [Synechococcaceae cyanobacterium]|nr:C1 family peptidase [Synechococcaceae cyanobacterium]